MIRLLADANIQGHIAHLVTRMQSESWVDFWTHLQVQYVSFDDVGLIPSDTDEKIWHCCQDQQLLLLTDNRNADGPQSLEAIIRSCNTAQSLPVFTIGDARRVLASNEYAERVVDRLFRYLLDLDGIRGTGRLFLP